MRLPLTRVTFAALAAGALLGFATCRVNLGDDKYIFSCATDGDCAGDGYKCAVTAGRGTCCKPTGPEICDGIDNDCDGAIDNTGKQEICNGVDDDCNGKVDEGYNLKTDTNNCGTCGHICSIKDVCVMGTCMPVLEFNCSDGVDNDDNLKTDCEDPSCDKQSCGPACICGGLKKTEAACSDGVDNDGDLLIDCADPDCTGKACATGCTCIADGGSIETACDDGVDNDSDTLTDCFDPDCLGKYCTPPPIFFACTAAHLCKCNGGVQVAEVGSKLCNDDIDNDCNGKKDCGEASCNGQTCSPDGGAACTCVGGVKKETDCANLTDDDGDNLIDCGDSSDCPQGTPCTKAAGGAGTCGATKNCE